MMAKRIYTRFLLVGMALLGSEVCLAQTDVAASLYWAFASAGSVALVWLFGEIAEVWSWQAALLCTLALLVLNQIATVALPPDARRTTVTRRVA